MSFFSVAQFVAGILAARADALLSGVFMGFKPPKLIVGNFYRPLGYNGIGTGPTTTATRVYYFPLVIWDDYTFQGASIVNSGAADNGKKIRLMVFKDNNANGGPGTLEKDFGEITLTGAAAARTLSSSWSARRGVYWGAVWTESSCALAGMAPFVASSFSLLFNPVNFIGEFTCTDQRSILYGHYVDTTYGAAPASATAPTASISNTTVGADTGGIPAFWLKA